MNKISKKIVSLVTMAAFVLTLVPAAAFAADPAGTKGNVSVGNSSVTISQKTANVAQLNFTLKAADGTEFESTDSDNALINAIIAVTDENGKEVNVNVNGSDDNQWAGATTNTTIATEICGKYEFRLPLDPGTYDISVNVPDGKGGYTKLAGSVEDFYVAGTADRQASYFLTDKSNVTVGVGDTVNAGFEINDSYTYPTPVALDNVVIWAVEKGHDIADPSTALKFIKPDGETGHFADAVSATNDTDVQVSFTRSGTYTLYAGVGSDVEAASKALLGSVEGYQVVVVEAAEVGDVDNVVIGDGATVTADPKIYNANTSVKPNSTASATHTVTAYINGVPAKSENFKISTSNSNIMVTAKNANGTAYAAGTATTDRNGEFELSYKIAKAGSYKIYLTAEDGYQVQLNVTSDGVEHYADTIALADFDAAIMNKDDLNAKANPYLSDAVRFVITDNNGVTLDGADATNVIFTQEPSTGNGTNKTDYVELNAPEKFKGEAKDFYLAYDGTNKVYTLQYKGTADFVPGEYTVRVALLENGNHVDATFSVGEFDENAVTGIKVVPNMDTIAYTKGSTGFTFKVKAVDANGVEKDITNTGDANIGVNAPAIVQAALNGNNVTFKTSIDAADKDQYVGNEITVTAVSERYRDIETATVTIVDEGVVESLAFDSENGEADKTNRVEISVVDADGNPVKDISSSDIYAYVADKSNADANIEIEVVDQVDKGEGGVITIYSDKATTVDVVVAVKDAAAGSNAIYAGTLTYTIGEADVNADTLLGMTIGSTDYIVNNDVISGDAAPYIDENWRTMVPVRVLNETFGGTVDFKDNVITIVNGDTTVVMTIGEETYTVNGDEKTMDTAPVIRDNDRAYVPVRFMAEALGYTVTPLQAADGTTAGVVFQK